MNSLQLGLLHPGAMGASLGAALSPKYKTGWVSEGRSAQTRLRAKEAGLLEFLRLKDLVEQTDILFSVCPPSEAVALAKQSINAGYKGIYVDANAVSPATATEIAQLCQAAGLSYVDGGIIGPPARQADSTRLYLSGDKAPEVAELFAGSLLEAIVLDAGPNSASSLKMVYAAWTKGSSALLLNVRALAKALEVEDALLSEWERSLPELSTKSERAASAAAPKAWRFAGEMNEIASTFAAASLPAGFHQAAAQVYERLSDFKNQTSSDADKVIGHLLENKSH